MSGGAGSGAADLAELVGLVAREVDEGRRAAAELAARTGGLQVAAVRVKLGRAASPPGEDPPPGPLPPGRYPPAQDGWEVEVDLRAGAGPRARVRDGGWDPVPRPPSLLDVFGDQPVAAVKGAGPAWSKRLGAAGVATVGDLAAAPAADIARLVRRSRSRRPLELHVKARLLEVAAPWLPPSPADEQPLWDLAGAAPAELRRLIGRSATRDADRLAALLARLVTALDAAVLRSATLADVRGAGALSPPGPQPT